MSLQIPFDDPIKFHDGRQYNVGEWSCAPDDRRGVRVTAEVARVDSPHHSPRYCAWGDWFAFELYFPDIAPENEVLVNQALLFSRLWMSRHLRENRQPRAQSRTRTTIEGSFAA